MKKLIKLAFLLLFVNDVFCQEAANVPLSEFRSKYIAISPVHKVASIYMRFIIEFNSNDTTYYTYLMHGEKFYQAASVINVINMFAKHGYRVVAANGKMNNQNDTFSIILMEKKEE